MKQVLLATLLMQAACGSDQGCFVIEKPTVQMPAPCTVPQLGGVIENDALRFVADFSAEAISRGVPCYNTPYIGFKSDLDRDRNTMVGYCISNVTVRFVAPYWEAFTEQSKRTLVYHELGHCALNREHTADTEIDIMNPYLLSDHDAEANWSELVTNLFGGEKL